MLKSRTQTNILSLQQSKQINEEKSKKYRCDCCKDKKNIDYNRQNRLKRESASSKKMNFTHRPSTRYNSQQNNPHLPNTALISSIQNYQIRAKEPSCKKKLPAILQSPQILKQQTNQDNKSSLKPSKVDMKSFCKNLFSTSKPKISKHRIQVFLNGESYFMEFNSTSKMKLAIGQLKMLIQNCQEIKKEQFSS